MDHDLRRSRALGRGALGLARQEKNLDETCRAEKTPVWRPKFEPRRAAARNRESPKTVKELEAQLEAARASIFCRPLPLEVDHLRRPLFTNLDVTTAFVSARTGVRLSSEWISVPSPRTIKQVAHRAPPVATTRYPTRQSPQFPDVLHGVCADRRRGRLVSSTVPNFKQRCRKVCRCRR